MSDSFALVVHPHSEEEVFRTVSDFCESLFDAVKAEGGEAGKVEARGVSEEFGKALRNMAGLARRVEKASDGRTIRIDPAMDLARACGGNRPELVAEVLKRIRLEQRTVTQFRFNHDDRASGLEKLRDLFASVNKGLRSEVSLPRRVDITVPWPLFGRHPFSLGVIDTKGVDDTAIRPDIRAYLDDPRTFTVLCSRFNSAPDSSMQQLLENLISTGAERTISERVALLVLARAAEVLDTQDDTGSRIQSMEEGYQIKEDQIQAALSKLKGVKLEILFFDVLSDDAAVVCDRLVACVQGMRDAQAQRIAEAGQAAEELIRRHGEAQMQEAQDKVRKRLRIFIEHHRELGVPGQTPQESFMAAIGRTHAGTVWATTRRNGTWGSLHAYQWLGDGTAVDARNRSQSAFFGLDEQLTNMFGDPELEPARDYLNVLRRTAPVWRERFLAEATSSGREIFRAHLFPDGKVWGDCERYWGGGAGFRDRVKDRLENWFDSHVDLGAAVEKRVQSAWREAFLVPLATLCGSLDLLGTEDCAVGHTAA